MHSCKTLDDFHPRLLRCDGDTTSTLADGVAWHTARDMLAAHGLAAFLALSADDSPHPRLPDCPRGERGSLAASAPLAHASDGVLFYSLRSSFVRLAATLTTIFTAMLAYFARSNWRSQLEHSGGRCSQREGSARASQQPQPAVLTWL